MVLHDQKLSAVDFPKLICSKNIIFNKNTERMLIDEKQLQD